MASAEKIDEVIRLIVANYDPDEIRLFGSHARGNAADRSDVDLLILKETDEPFPRRVRRVEQLLLGTMLRFDINVYTRAELQRALEHPYSLMSRIVTRQAKTVYSKCFPDYEAIVRAWEAEPSAERHRRLTEDPSEWRLFQTLYEKERARWPVPPVEIIARRIGESHPAGVVADLGCGDARLAELLAGLHVVSIDHIAGRPGVLPADLAAVPLEPAEVGAAVFSLSLIGRNWRDYLREANRILRPGGSLFVAEPQRRAGAAAFRLLDAITASGFGLRGEAETREGVVYVTAVKRQEA